MILTWLSMVAAVNNASASCRVAQIIMNQTAQMNVMERLMHRDSARMGAERVVYAGIAPFFGVRSTHLQVGGPDEAAGFRARLLEIEQLLSRGRTR